MFPCNLSKTSETQRTQARMAFASVKLCPANRGGLSKDSVAESGNFM